MSVLGGLVRLSVWDWDTCPRQKGWYLDINPSIEQTVRDTVASGSRKVTLKPFNPRAEREMHLQWQQEMIVIHTDMFFWKRL
jgi:hypothetical protein